MLFNFPCFIINETTRNLYINYIDCALSWCIKHAGNKVWNATNKEILREGMKHGFERMCIVYERLVAKVCFFIYLYAIMYILLYI
jgi:hypothetical protein